jgi:hypothetical protein
MRYRLDPSALRALLGAPSYREFARIWIEERAKVRRFGFADVARIGKFASRSFPRDVIRGTKRLTPRSVEKFAAGLGLRGDLAEYFRTLVEKEEVGCRSPGTNLPRLEKLASGLRRRLAKKAAGAAIRDEEAIFEEDFPRIYASLGSTESGATLGEIAGRSRLATKNLRPALDRLLERGVVLRRGIRYYAGEPHLHLEGMRGKGAFSRRFSRNASRAIDVLETKIDSDECLFFASTYSVRSNELPSLKEELRGVLQRYVDGVEKPEGDKIIELTVSMID